jgi:serine/threonine-protein kinase RsbW
VTQELRLPWDDDPEDLYEHAPCGYLTTLPDGTVVRVNQTFLNWTGYDRSDLIGHRRFRDLLTPGCQIYHETHYAPLLSMQSEVHEIALDVVRADGARVPVLVNSVLERSAGGAPRVIRTMVFNATERRSYENELLHAREFAEASEKRVQVLQQIVADLAAAPTEAEPTGTVPTGTEPTEAEPAAGPPTEAEPVGTAADARPPAPPGDIGRALPVTAARAGGVAFCSFCWA